MLSKNFRDPFAEDLDGTNLIGKTFRIGLRKIHRGPAMDDAMRKSHPGSAAGGHPNRIHPAAQKKSFCFCRFPKQERSIHRETFRTVEQFLDFRMLKGRNPMDSVKHHRLEVFPILLEKLEGKVFSELCRINGFSHRFKTTHQQSP